ncbi:MAG TPA: hypothetical protein VF432_26675 [Thermoanaerobaculia bacterium]
MSLARRAGDVDPSSAAHAFSGPGLTFASGVTGTTPVVNAVALGN